MSKIITSPVPKFAGTVTLSDPLTYPQVIAYERAVAAVRESATTLAEMHQAMLPGLFACVEAWNLAGLPDPVTPENFPATPRVASTKLVSWLVSEVAGLYGESEEIPNA